MSALTTRDALATLDRRLASLENSPIGNRCVNCGHVKHNDLGYCQNGQCDCDTGTTVASLARIIRRDTLASGAVIDAATLADDEALVAALMHRWGCDDTDEDAYDAARADLEVIATALTERGQDRG